MRTNARYAYNSGGPPKLRAVREDNMPDVSVNKANHKISVSHPSVIVHIGESVRWVSSSGHFQIKFKKGSDWKDPDTKENGGMHTAECQPFDKEGKLYYSVLAQDHDELDPEIDVRP